jgi:molybdopterin-biosynthesis enzyme MoeA-like protein
MAGVPSIMRGMLQDIAHRIEGGAVVRAVTVRGKGVREGDIAAGLAALESAAPHVSFGSYPWFLPNDFGVHLVARTADLVALAEAAENLKALIREFGAEPEEVAEPPA